MPSTFRFILVGMLLYLGLVRPRMAVRVAIVMVVLGTFYVFIGPLFVKGIAAHKARRDAKASSGE